MLELRNKTRGASKVGYFVKVVQDGFKYAGPGDTPIGVVTEVIPSGEMCKIQTNGEALVYVGHTVKESDPLRMALSDSGELAGVAYSAVDQSVYVSLGNATQKGRGLIKVALNMVSAGVSAGTGGDVPAGGTTGQALTKVDGTDHNVTWSTVSTISDATPDGVAYSRRNNAWVDSNLVIDYSGGTGAQRAQTAYGEDVTFIGDGTYISTGYQFIGTPGNGVHEISITLTPGALDTRWDLMTADGTVATSRPYTTAQIGNTANVAFLEGVYTTVSYFLNNVFTDYNPAVTEPVNEVTIEVDHNQMNSDGIFYSKSEVNTLLTSYATQTWVNNNFDDYVSWNYEYDTVSPQSKAIGSGDSFGLVPGTDIGFSWDGANNRQTINYTGTPGSMDDWYFQVNADANHVIANHTQVNFQSGTNITLAYTFATPVHGLTVSLNSSVTGLTLLDATTVSVTSTLKSTTTSLFMGTTGAGNVYIRPNGFGSSTDQSIFGTSVATIGTNMTVNAGSITTMTVYGSTTGAAWGAALVLKTSSSIRGRGIFHTVDDTSAEWFAGIGYSQHLYSIGYDVSGGQSEYAANNLITITTGGVVTLGGNFRTTDQGISVGPSTGTGGLNAIDMDTSTSYAGAGIIGDDLGYTGIKFYDGSVGNMTIFNKRNSTNFGKILFATGATPTVRLTIDNAGDVWATGSIYAAGELESWDTSDINLKRHVKDIKLTRARKLLNVSVIEYEHIKKKKQEIGLIYQEIKEIFSEVTRENPEGDGMVQYGKLVAPIVLLLQDIDQRLEGVENKLARY